nr:MFS transporter [Pullulanibacillus pueri]
MGTISFIQPVLTLFYLSRGLDETDIIWMLMFWSGFVLIGEVPSGIFADRFGAKRSFITGGLIHFISILVLVFAHNPWQFFLSSALSGLAATFFSGADEALIYDSLKESHEENKMDHAMGRINAAEFITMMIAVILGAFLAHDLTEAQFLVLLYLGLGFQAIGIVILFFVKKPIHSMSYRDNPFKQVREGVRVIRRTPQLLIMFLNVTIVFIPAGAVFGNFDQPFLQGAGLPVSWIGIIYALAAGIGFFASYFIGWFTRRLSRVFLMHVTGFLAVGGLLLASFFGERLTVALFSFFILRFVRAIRYPIYSQLSNDWIPSTVRATTISLLSIIDSAADLIIFSTIASIAAFGLPRIFLICAVIALIGTLFPIRKGDKVNLH